MTDAEQVLFQQAEVARLNDKLLAQQREIANLKSILREVEWAAYICPWCGNDEDDGHTPDCKLAKALED